MMTPGEEKFQSTEDHQVRRHVCMIIKQIRDIRQSLKQLSRKACDEVVSNASDVTMMK